MIETPQEKTARKNQSKQNWAKQMSLMRQIHVEIAPQLDILRKLNERFDGFRNFDKKAA